VPGWRLAVIIVGVVSALLTALMALYANDLKRVLAYSTVSQLGFMIYAIGAGDVYASQFHLLSHSVFKALLFLCAGAIIHSAGTRDMRLMGGLGKKMPLVRTTFIIGALALAGIPILNGFWSKELVLEAGKNGSPMWAYILMVIVAGLTALYTLRCVWLVFFGEPRSELHVHDAAPAMRISLVTLAAGTLLTWLLAGPFSTLLKSTLPYHTIEAASTGEILLRVITAPATYLALAVIALGILTWVWREHLVAINAHLGWLQKAATNSFGFEAINHAIVDGTQSSAEALRVTQTGELNWNIVGLIGGLIIVLASVILGALL
jgi:NADH-quinone oxidoreductase subunit L